MTQSLSGRGKAREQGERGKKELTEQGCVHKFYFCFPSFKSFTVSLQILFSVFMLLLLPPEIPISPNTLPNCHISHTMSENGGTLLNKEVLVYSFAVCLHNFYTSLCQHQHSRPPNHTVLTSRAHSVNSQQLF